MNFFQMTSAEVDAAAERYYDRLYDRWEAQFVDDPWDTDEPGWQEIADLVDCEDTEIIAGYLRDWMEGDGDLYDEAYRAGAIDEYIHPEDRVGTDDPDREWQMVDSVFNREWNNDDFMKAIYIWLPENHLKAMCEWLMDRADSNGIRDLYNKDKGWN